MAGDRLRGDDDALRVRAAAEPRTAAGDHGGDAALRPDVRGRLDRRLIDDLDQFIAASRLTQFEVVLERLDEVVLPAVVALAGNEGEDDEAEEGVH
jgi:hypothetical protein